MPEVGRQHQATDWVQPSDQPIQGAPDVPFRPGQLLEPPPLVGGQQPGSGTRPDLKEPAGVPIPDRLGLAGFGQPLDAELPNCLQHPVTTTGLVPDQQGLLDQPTGEVRDRRRHLTVGSAHGRHGCQVEATREDRQPPEQDPFLLLEKGMAPLHGRVQRALPPSGPAPGPG